MLEHRGRGGQHADCLVGAGAMIARIDHAAQHVGVEPARDIEITAQMRGPDASGAEFQPHTAAGGVAAKAVEISRLVGLDRRIVADLEQADAEIGGPVDHLGKRERVLGSVVPLPEEGVGAEADGHRATAGLDPANACVASRTASGAGSWAHLSRKTPMLLNNCLIQSYSWVDIECRAALISARSDARLPATVPFLRATCQPVDQ